MSAGLNLIQQALSIFDSDLKLAVCNHRFQEMFGFPDELVRPGVAFEDIITYLVDRGEYGPVDDRDEAIRSRVDAARAFEPHYMERRRANGRWISVEGAPLAQGGWVAVYTDITEVKLQEQLLKSRSEELSGELLKHAERLAQANRELAAANARLEETKRELVEMEARTRLTTEMMPAHIAHMNRGLRYTFSNRRLSAVMPGRPRDIVGLGAPEVLGSAFDKIAPSLERALQGQDSVHEFTDDDSGRRIRVAFTPDRVRAGPITGVYILSMDVTEETQARAALAQTRKRELAAQLSSGLAHDFGNLLTIILGLQGRLLRTPDLPEDVLEIGRATIAAARRGGVLLDRIAHISGHREIRAAPTDVEALLDDLNMMASPSLPETARLRVWIDGVLPPLMLDAGAVQDSLLNLILNARDALGNAGGEIALSARAVRDTWLEITVTDTGPGFSEAALDRGLEPFFTTKGGEGSGLGLAMVYDQITLCGGTVRLANRPEGGACVTLRLPLRPVAAGQASGMVLLIEDSTEIREAVRAMLRDLGFSVIEAASADEALQLAELPGIEIVLSDINLPGETSGLELARHLRARGLKRLRLMTSLPKGDPLRRAAAAEFQVLGKPFGPAALQASMMETVA
ncbi:MAG: PAS-domain containing protein [Rhodobacteraceae bacterium]|nr:PAS-domain containing protein [Paracoccaceae bacterium]